MSGIELSSSSLYFDIFHVFPCWGLVTRRDWSRSRWIAQFLPARLQLTKDQCFSANCNEGCFQSHEKFWNLHFLCFCFGFTRSCIYSEPMLTMHGSVPQGCFVGMDAMNSDSQREGALQLLQFFPILQEGNVSLLHVTVQIQQMQYRVLGVI